MFYLHIHVVFYSYGHNVLLLYVSLYLIADIWLVSYIHVYILLVFYVHIYIHIYVYGEQNIVLVLVPHVDSDK